MGDLLCFIAGLEVCFLTDSMCRGLAKCVTQGKVWVHPGTTVERSRRQHLFHVKEINKEALVLIHIGTNDLAGGSSPEELVNKMEALIHCMENMCRHKMVFAVSSILVDNKEKGGVVKYANKLLERWCASKTNVLFLQTYKLFVKHGELAEEMFRRDGVHLNDTGKQKLFKCFRHFLWHVCRCPVKVYATKTYTQV